MHIEIHLPRPMLTILTVAAVSGWAVALWPGADMSVAPIAVTAQVIADSHAADTTTDHEQPAPAPRDDKTQRTRSVVESNTDAGDSIVPAAMLERAAALERARQIREEQGVLGAKEDILRAQLEALDAERSALKTVDPKLEELFRRSTRMLADLIQDHSKAEEFLRTTLNQIWEAEGRAVKIASGPMQNADYVSLLWPVAPLKGISAYWHDVSYEQKFKMRHNAVDIPTPQGTVVLAAAGGIVTDVVDHGLGFNYVTIQHLGGYSTLYGHLTSFMVQKGQQVVAGDPIGYSGGRWGTKGAGISTGPHLHFGVFMNGTSVDPLKYLPKISQ